MRESRSLRVLAKLPRLDLDTGKTIAINRKAGSIFFAEQIANRNAFEILALGKHFLEALAIAGGDRDDLTQSVDRLIQFSRFGRRDFQGAGGKVVCQYGILPIVNDPARRRRRHQRDPVIFRQRVVVLEMHHL
jgi:hypothetical protein